MSTNIVYIILAIVMLGANGICLSMEPKSEDSWLTYMVQKDIISSTDEKGNTIDVVPKDKATLKLYLEENDKHSSYGILQETNGTSIRIDLNGGHFFRQNKNQGNLVLGISHLQQRRELHITSWEAFCGPEENHDAKASSIMTNSDSVTFTTAGQKIDLYDSGNIKKIREALMDNKLFIVKFMKNGADFLKVKVETASNGAHLWWDGWKPLIMMRQALQKCSIGKKIDLLSKLINNEGVISNPQIIEINLDEDQKSASAYKRNKYLGYFSIVGISGLMIALLWKIKNAGSEFLYGAPNKPQIMYRGNDQGFVEY